jgi:hypothetical protein
MVDLLMQPTAGLPENGKRLHLAYFVHDLGDAAVARRLAMLQPFLASAVVIGFHRAQTPPLTVAGWPAVALGRTADGKLARRAFSVLRNLALLRRLRRDAGGVDFMLARQLEMLPLAVAVRRRYAKSAGLAYECLDIHGAMLGPSPISKALRWLEGRLLRATTMVIISAPDFKSAYLQPVHGAWLPPVCLIENKVLQSEAGAAARLTRPPGPPWRIGWYGVLRCRRSLELLIDLTRQLPGQVIVDLRGRPARSAIPDFDALVAGAPNVRFLGTYDRKRDLAEIYQAVHFTWAIDFYEAGLNSTWLLPNRLYEGGLHGAIPIAIANVATGRWLASQNAGILLDACDSDALLQYFSGLSQAKYDSAAAALAAVPVARWADDGTDGKRLMQFMIG